MCHDENSSVPLAPGEQGGVTGAELELSTSDGNAYPAHLARPERPAAGPPIVLLPDAGGLHSFYKELADRFAGLGQPT